MRQCMLKIKIFRSSCVEAKIRGTKVSGSETMGYKGIEEKVFN